MDGVVLNAPSVMMNGLLVTNTDGTVAHKMLLPTSLVSRAIEFGAAHGLTTHAYLDDGRNVVAEHDEWSERVKVFEEPELEEIGASQFAALGGNGDGGETGPAAAALRVFKLVWWGSPVQIVRSTWGRNFGPTLRWMLRVGQ